MRMLPAFILLAAGPWLARAADGNRLTYLDECDPYYVSRTFPKLITPQWVGEEGVEAVVVLAIDDMRDPERYEQFLRPILRRLQKIDGRAPVSIMTCEVDPKHPRLQQWLKEGLSLEVHTIDHPCPFFAGGDFAKAKSTYDRCVDLMNRVPGNKPVAFRMPCCDSLNTVSPRFFSEIFNKTTGKGNFLAIDSSVFNVLTSNDPDLPRALVIDPDGQDKFLKYLPRDRSFVNWVENYPYPYVIDKLCWEFPCVVPSDWEAQHYHKPNNPITVRDWKAALDAIVLKQGVFTMVFHPHGWIKSEQIVELIEHAVAKHGKKVKFLTFRDCLERLNKNQLKGQPLRDPKNGAETASARRPPAGRDAILIDSSALPPGARLAQRGTDYGLRLIDLDGDGHQDIVFSNEKEYGIYLYSEADKGWTRKVAAGKANEPGALPPIAVNGKNNGFWVHSGHLWWHNENTSLLKDHVSRRSFDELLQNVEPQAKSPEASLHSWKPRPGFEVELVACEPLVQSPIAFAWGPDGKLWVVEMGDYPLGVDGKGKPGGRIKFLEDTKGTGKYDKATVFLDGLPFPTGVMPWGKGVLVTCAPDIFYAEDTDGDGKADVRRTLYTGFNEGNQQHRVNGLVWGLDNWIYGANGDSDGVIKSLKTGKTVNISGRDFRIRPDEGLIDAQTGRTQYGRCRDDWGNWFGCNNSDPMYHFVLADQYLRRNPHIAPPSPRVQVSDQPGASRVYPVSRTLPRFNDPGAANHFTSACSVIVYRDDLFGPQFEGNSFVSEPVHNLIHREIMVPKGVTFTSHRAIDEQQSEFLASTDNWTRPTMIQTGPDGALWIADMYRQVIEHPEWIPKDWQKRLDLRAGHDKGRIYRVYPVGRRPRPIPRLDRMSTAELVAALDSPNGWQRDTAQQLLIQRKDATAKPLLEKMITENKRPLARMQALCTLDGLELLSAAYRHALEDPHPGVRRQAVRICPMGVADPLIGRLLIDPDPGVRMGLAYSLGRRDAGLTMSPSSFRRQENLLELLESHSGKPLGQLALQDANDPYLSAAVLSSVNRENLELMLLTVLAGDGKGPPPAALIENLLRLADALGNTRALSAILARVASPGKNGYAPWQFAALAALLDALEQKNRSLQKLAETDERMKATLPQLDFMFASARKLFDDKKASPEERLQAVRILGRGFDRQQDDVKLLTGLLVPQTAADLQAAAVTTLGKLRDPSVPELLLRGWKGYAPALRAQVLDVLLRRGESVQALLAAIEVKQVMPFEIDAARRQRLLQHADESVRKRTAQLFVDAINPDRQKVVESYRSVLTLKGDRAHGQQVFAKSCATCHRFQNEGHAVGPDLASVGDKSPEGLLVAILDPNRAVEARYINYVAQTKNGLTLTGVLTSETGNSITLLGPDGKQQVILRTDLEELLSSNKSLMPEGLEKDLQPQDIADLIAHIRSREPAQLPKTFAGNKPELVRPADDDSFKLYANMCAIYGSTVVFEQQYGNLGYWQSADDRAVWTVDIRRPGKYTVRLDWACPEDNAGNTYVVQAGLQRLTGKVPATKSWNDYRQAVVGEITLEAGQQQIVFRSEGKLKGCLLDLRSIKLLPVAAK